MEALSFAQIVGGFATGLGVGVALFAAFYARSEVRTSRYSSALQTFQRYQELSLSRLNLAEPDYGSLVSTGRKTEYMWFVGIFLTACEEIILHVGQKDYWISTIDSHIRKHAEFLLSVDFQDKKLHHYAPPMRKRIQTALKGVNLRASDD